jgi:HEAT repeat protein
MPRQLKEWEKQRIMNGFSDSCWAARCRAISNAVEYEFTDALERITACALRDRDEDVRERAAIALGKLGNSETIAVLEQVAKNDRYSDVKTAARASLAQLRQKFPVSVEQTELQPA